MKNAYAQGLSPLFSSWFATADKWSGLPETADLPDIVRARAIFILGMVFILMATCLPIIGSRAGLLTPQAFSLSMIAIVGMIASLFLLKHSNNPAPAGLVFCLSASMGLVLWPGLDQGVFAPTHFLLALTPLLWGLMVNARACLIYSIALLAFVIGITELNVGVPLAINADASQLRGYYGTLLTISTVIAGTCTAGYALMTNFMISELKAQSQTSDDLALAAERARRDVELAGEKFQTFADIASDWLWETNARGIVTYFGGRNSGGLKRSTDNIIGKHFLSFLEFRKEDLEALKQALSQADGYCDIPVRFVDEDGEASIFELSAKPILGDDGTVNGYMGVGKDVTARVKAENDVRFLAANDKLTGLSNRHTFNARINEELTETTDRGSVLFAIDLDDFKSVNDSYGHHIGDALLIEVAARINASIRKGDWAARLGGDEFVVMAVNYDPDKWALDLLADRLLKALSEPYRIEELELHMSASIGCARFPADANNARDLTQFADMALYAAKQGGRNQWRAYTPAMRQVAHQRKLMETGLRAALDADQINVWYQPLINLETNSVTGFEALARWTDDERGPVPPQIFIDVAEKCGLIGELGEYVLRRACADAKRWGTNEAGKAPRVSVNISPIQFADSAFPDLVSAVLKETELPASRLELEITESILMADIDNAVRMLEALEHIGVGIAIDDFGTGYSSLSYLKRFPLNRLKVDRSFVHDLESDEHDRTITNTVVKLGESLGLSVVAEGVETEGQRVWLKSMGCEEVQGYLYAKPMPGDQVAGFLQDAPGLVDELAARRSSKQSA